MLKEIVITLIICGVIFAYIIKAFGKHTNIDDPLDEKFWK